MGLGDVESERRVLLHMVGGSYDGVDATGVTVEEEGLTELRRRRSRGARSKHGVKSFAACFACGVAAVLAAVGGVVAWMPQVREDPMPMHGTGVGLGAPKQRGGLTGGGGIRVMPRPLGFTEADGLSPGEKDWLPRGRDKAKGGGGRLSPMKQAELGDFLDRDSAEEALLRRFRVAAETSHGITRRNRGEWFLAALGLGDKGGADGARKVRKLRLEATAQKIGIRRHDEVEYREANLGQAKGMPPLVFINIPECDGPNNAMASILRRTAMRHGLRGGNSGVDVTLVPALQHQMGTPAVIADGVSMADLQQLQQQNQLDDFPYVLTILDDPLERAVAAFVHHGVSQSGWRASKKNLETFLLGTGDANLGAFDNFHRGDFIARRVASTVEIAKLDQGAILNEEDISRVLDRYNLVGTRSRLNESLVLLKMTVPTLELRDVVQVPSAGYAASDPFGFATADFMGRANALEPEARAWIESEEFKAEFRRLNPSDYALYEAAQARLDIRIQNEGPSYGRHVWWMNQLNQWLEDRLAHEPVFQKALKMPRAAVLATKCEEGLEGECAQRLLQPHVGDAALQEQAKEHEEEGCMFLNQGCFAQLVIDITLAQYKRAAERQIEGTVDPSQSAEGIASALGGQGGGTAQNQAARVMSGELDEAPTSGDNMKYLEGEPLKRLVDTMTVCSKSAEVNEVKTCNDDATFGWGLSGKRIIAATAHVYILCYKETCTEVCVPRMWADKTTVLDGAQTDRCFGFDREESSGYMDHWHKASLMHAAAIAHARDAGHAPVSIIESDAVFVEAEKLGSGAQTEDKTGVETKGPGIDSFFIHGRSRIGEPVPDAGMEDFQYFGKMDGPGGVEAGSQGETARLKGLLGQARWTAEDEHDMIELVMSGRQMSTADSTAKDGGRWSVIRLGYRAMDFESQAASCPTHCGCWHKAGEQRWCTVHTHGCDMRAAHAYIVSADAYALMLREILATPGYSVIDAGTLQRIPQQVFVTPMLAVQKHAQADLITPAQQLAHANTFARACATGVVGWSRQAVGEEAQSLLTKHANRELGPYLPQVKVQKQVSQ